MQLQGFPPNGCSKAALPVYPKWSHAGLAGVDLAFYDDDISLFASSDGFYFRILLDDNYS